MEVLFAVLVLTMGLVFVAANFPLGIMNAAKVAESTRTIIDTHNAEVMTELQLGGIADTGYFGATPSYIITDGDIHLLSMPNVRVDEYVVMDDPGELYFTTSGEVTPEYWTYTKDGAADISNRELPYFITNINNTYLDKKNIGMTVSPMVDRSDRQVLAKLIGMGNDLSLADGDQPTSFWDDLNIAIYDVAMERNYSWCSLYRHITGNTYSLYIFTLRNHNKNARYAIQESTAFIAGELTAETSDNDRLFPVPWRIDLGALGMAYWGHPDWNHTMPLQDFYNDRFIVPEALTRLLQTGSILIDGMKGHQFEVLDVYASDDSGQWYYVRVSPSLERWMVPEGGTMEGVMGQFWFVPPPIVRAAPDYFEGKQPVVKVTQKNFSF